MVNKEKFYETIKNDEKLDANYPWREEAIWKPRLEALGDDEDDIIEFMDNADKETLSAICDICEDIFTKFPSDKMEQAMDRFEKRYDKVFNANRL